jgi:hypothetical protein
MILLKNEWYVAKDLESGTTTVFKYLDFDGYYIHGRDVNDKLVIFSDRRISVTVATELVKALS